MTSPLSWNSSIRCPTYSPRSYPSISSSALFARTMTPSPFTQCRPTLAFSKKSARFRSLRRNSCSARSRSVVSCNTTPAPRV